MFNADNIIPNIDKRLIDNISDLELFKYYCSNFEEINKKFCSELRTDRNPSCYIYIKPNNKLAYKDFGSGEHYSPIEYIMKKYGLLYSECLNVIFNDFKLSNKIIPICKPENLIGYESVSDELKTPLKAKIYISSRNWRLCDNKYWGQYYITFDLLEKYNVIPCQKVFLYTKSDKMVEFSHRENNPIYAYKFIKPGGEISYKIYFPYEEKHKKWLFSGGSSEDIEGYDELPWIGDLLILTKSLKDCMVYNILGYNAISLQGEANKVPKELIDKLLKRFNRIIVNYDNDEQGIKSSRKININYGFKEIFIPIESKCKDLSDYIKMYGIEKTKILLNECI